jgi:prephenate dehydrogenase
MGGRRAGSRAASGGAAPKARSSAGPRWRRVTVIGTGLIGGSLALALRRRGRVGEIVGVGRGVENLALARRRRVVDRVTTDPVEGVRGADLVVLATPVGALPELAKTIAPALRTGAIVTDVGSVKERVMRAVEPAIQPHAYFVGGHPIAGAEDSGAGAASASLFEGRRCILTPTPRTDAAALGRIRRMWTGVGARVIEMSPVTHDRILGAVSHLPHVVAFALVNAVSASEKEALDFAGAGFRDFTRIAASHAEMWRDIVLDNRECVLASLEAAQGELARIRALIDRRDGARLLQAFRKARETRRSLNAATRPAGGASGGRRGLPVKAAGERPLRKSRRKT